MNLIYLTRSEIDTHRWDSFMEISMQGVVYGFSWYLDVVCENWNALVWPSADEYQIVMPLPVKSIFGFSVLYQPHFCQYLGLFSTVELTHEKVAVFLKACSDSFSYISSYCFHPTNTQLLGTALNSFPELQQNTNKTVWLSVQSEYNGYTKDRRKNLLRADQWKWQEEMGDDIEPLIDLFRHNHMSKITGGVAEKSLTIFKKLFEECLKRGNSELKYAYHEGILHAGVLIIREGNIAVYIFNAADFTGRRGNARTFLLNNYFKMKGSEELVFDFESPDITSIHNFYRSFGGIEVPFINIRKNDLKFPYNVMHRLRSCFLKARR